MATTTRSAHIQTFVHSYVLACLACIVSSSSQTPWNPTYLWKEKQDTILRNQDGVSKYQDFQRIYYNLIHPETTHINDKHVTLPFVINYEQNNDIIANKDIVSNKDNSEHIFFQRACKKSKAVPVNYLEEFRKDKKTLYLIGYDEEIFIIIDEIMYLCKRNIKYDLIIHFYIIFDNQYLYIDSIVCNIEILKLVLDKHTHYYCVKSKYINEFIFGDKNNVIMIPKASNSTYIDYDLNNCIIEADIRKPNYYYNYEGIPNFYKVEHAIKNPDKTFDYESYKDNINNVRNNAKILKHINYNELNKDNGLLNNETPKPADIDYERSKHQKENIDIIDETKQTSRNLICPCIQYSIEEGNPSKITIQRILEPNAMLYDNIKYNNIFYKESLNIPLQTTYKFSDDISFFKNQELYNQPYKGVPLFYNEPTFDTLMGYAPRYNKRYQFSDSPTTTNYDIQKPFQKYSDSGFDLLDQTEAGLGSTILKFSPKPRILKQEKMVNPRPISFQKMAITQEQTLFEETKLPLNQVQQNIYQTMYTHQPDELSNFYQTKAKSLENISQFKFRPFSEEKQSINLSATLRNVPGIYIQQRYPTNDGQVYGQPLLNIGENYLFDPLTQAIKDEQYILNEPRYLLPTMKNIVPSKGNKFPVGMIHEKQKFDQFLLPQSSYPFLTNYKNYLPYRISEEFIKELQNIPIYGQSTTDRTGLDILIKNVDPNRPMFTNQMIQDTTLNIPSRHIDLSTEPNYIQQKELQFNFGIQPQLYKNQNQPLYLDHHSIADKVPKGLKFSSKPKIEETAFVPKDVDNLFAALRNSQTYDQLPKTIQYFNKEVTQSSMPTLAYDDRNNMHLKLDKPKPKPLNYMTSDTDVLQLKPSLKPIHKALDLDEQPAFYQFLVDNGPRTQNLGKSTVKPEFGSMFTTQPSNLPVISVSNTPFDIFQVIPTLQKPIRDEIYFNIPAQTFNTRPVTIDQPLYFKTPINKMTNKFKYPDILKNQQTYTQSNPKNIDFVQTRDPTNLIVSDPFDISLNPEIYPPRTAPPTDSHIKNIIEKFKLLLSHEQPNVFNINRPITKPLFYASVGPMLPTDISPTIDNSEPQSKDFNINIKKILPLPDYSPKFIVSFPIDSFPKLSSYKQVQSPKSKTKEQLTQPSILPVMESFIKPNNELENYLFYTQPMRENHLKNNIPKIIGLPNQDPTQFKYIRLSQDPRSYTQYKDEINMIEHPTYISNYQDVSPSVPKHFLTKLNLLQKTDPMSYLSEKPTDLLLQTNYNRLPQEAPKQVNISSTVEIQPTVDYITNVINKPDTSQNLSPHILQATWKSKAFKPISSIGLYKPTFSPIFDNTINIPFDQINPASQLSMYFTPTDGIIKELNPKKLYPKAQPTWTQMTYSPVINQPLSDADTTVPYNFVDATFNLPSFSKSPSKLTLNEGNQNFNVLPELLYNYQIQPELVTKSFKKPHSNQLPPIFENYIPTKTMFPKPTDSSNVPQSNFQPSIENEGNYIPVDSSKTPIIKMQSSYNTILENPYLFPNFPSSIQPTKEAFSSQANKPNYINQSLPNYSQNNKLSSKDIVKLDAPSPTENHDFNMRNSKAENLKSVQPLYNNVISKPLKDPSLQLLNLDQPKNVNFSPQITLQPNIDEKYHTQQIKPLTDLYYQPQTLDSQEIPNRVKFSFSPKVQPNISPKKLSPLFSLQSNTSPTTGLNAPSKLQHTIDNEVYDTPLRSNIDSSFIPPGQSSLDAITPSPFEFFDTSIKPTPENIRFSPEIIVQSTIDKPAKVLSNAKQIPTLLQFNSLPEVQLKKFSTPVEQSTNPTKDLNLPFSFQPILDNSPYDMLHITSEPVQLTYYTLTDRPLGFLDPLPKYTNEYIGLSPSMLPQEFLDTTRDKQPDDILLDLHYPSQPSFHQKTPDKVKLSFQPKMQPNVYRKEWKDLPAVQLKISPTTNLYYPFNLQPPIIDRVSDTPWKSNTLYQTTAPRQPTINTITTPFENFDHILEPEKTGIYPEITPQRTIDQVLNEQFANPIPKQLKYNYILKTLPIINGNVFQHIPALQPDISPTTDFNVPSYMQPIKDTFSYDKPIASNSPYNPLAPIQPPSDKTIASLYPVDRQYNDSSTKPIPENIGPQMIFQQPDQRIPSLPKFTFLPHDPIKVNPSDFNHIPTPQQNMRPATNTYLQTPLDNSTYQSPNMYNIAYRSTTGQPKYDNVLRSPVNINSDHPVTLQSTFDPTIYHQFNKISPSKFYPSQSPNFKQIPENIKHIPNTFSNTRDIPSGPSVTSKPLLDFTADSLIKLYDSPTEVIPKNINLNHEIIYQSTINPTFYNHPSEILPNLYSSQTQYIQQIPKQFKLNFLPETLPINNRNVFHHLPALQPKISLTTDYSIPSYVQPAKDKLLYDKLITSNSPFNPIPPIQQSFDSVIPSPPKYIDSSEKPIPRTIVQLPGQQIPQQLKFRLSPKGQLTANPSEFDYAPTLQLNTRPTTDSNVPYVEPPRENSVYEWPHKYNIAHKYKPNEFSDDLSKPTPVNIDSKLPITRQSNLEPSMYPQLTEISPNLFYSPKLSNFKQIPEQIKYSPLYETQLTIQPNIITTNNFKLPSYAQPFIGNLEHDTLLTNEIPYRPKTSSKLSLDLITNSPVETFDPSSKAIPYDIDFGPQNSQSIFDPTAYNPPTEISSNLNYPYQSQNVYQIPELVKLNYTPETLPVVHREVFHHQPALQSKVSPITSLKNPSYIQPTKDILLYDTLAAINRPYVPIAPIQPLLGVDFSVTPIPENIELKPPIISQITDQQIPKHLKFSFPPKKQLTDNLLEFNHVPTHQLNMSPMADIKPSYLQPPIDNSVFELPETYNIAQRPMSPTHLEYKNILKKPSEFLDASSEPSPVDIGSNLPITVQSNSEPIMYPQLNEISPNVLYPSDSSNFKHIPEQINYSYLSETQPTMHGKELSPTNYVKLPLTDNLVQYKPLKSNIIYNPTIPNKPSFNVLVHSPVESIESSLKSIPKDRDSRPTIIYYSNVDPKTYNLPTEISSNLYSSSQPQNIHQIPKELKLNFVPETSPTISRNVLNHLPELQPNISPTTDFNAPSYIQPTKEKLDTLISSNTPTAPIQPSLDNTMAIPLESAKPILENIGSLKSPQLILQLPDQQIPKLLKFDYPAEKQLSVNPLELKHSPTSQLNMSPTTNNKPYVQPPLYELPNTNNIYHKPIEFLDDLSKASPINIDSYHPIKLQSNFNPKIYHQFNEISPDMFYSPQSPYFNQIPEQNRYNDLSEIQTPTQPPTSNGEQLRHIILQPNVRPKYNVNLPTYVQPTSDNIVSHSPLTNYHPYKPYRPSTSTKPSFDIISNSEIKFFDPSSKVIPHDMGFKPLTISQSTFNLPTELSPNLYFPSQPQIMHQIPKQRILNSVHETSPFINRNVFHHVPNTQPNLSPITDLNVPSYIQPTRDELSYDMLITSNTPYTHMAPIQPSLSGVIDKPFKNLNPSTKLMPENERSNPQTISQHTDQKLPKFTDQRIPKTSELNHVPTLLSSTININVPLVRTPLDNSVNKLSIYRPPPINIGLNSLIKLQSSFDPAKYDQLNEISPNIFYSSQSPNYKQIPEQFRYRPLSVTQPSINGKDLSHPSLQSNISPTNDFNIPLYSQPAIDKLQYDKPLTNDFLHRSTEPNEPSFNLLADSPVQFFGSTPEASPRDIEFYRQTIYPPTINPTIFNQPVEISSNLFNPSYPQKMYQISKQLKLNSIPITLPNMSYQGFHNPTKDKLIFHTPISSNSSHFTPTASIQPSLDNKTTRPLEYFDSFRNPIPKNIGLNPQMIFPLPGQQIPQRLQFTFPSGEQLTINPSEFNHVPTPQLDMSTTMNTKPPHLRPPLDNSVYQLPNTYEPIPSDQLEYNNILPSFVNINSNLPVTFQSNFNPLMYPKLTKTSPNMFYLSQSPNFKWIPKKLKYGSLSEIQPAISDKDSRHYAVQPNISPVNDFILPFYTQPTINNLVYNTTLPSDIHYGTIKTNKPSLNLLADSSIEYYDSSLKSIPKDRGFRPQIKPTTDPTMYKLPTGISPNLFYPSHPQIMQQNPKQLRLISSPETLPIINREVLQNLPRILPKIIPTSNFKTISFTQPSKDKPSYDTFITRSNPHTPIQTVKPLFDDKITRPPKYFDFATSLTPDTIGLNPQMMSQLTDRRIPERPKFFVPPEEQMTVNPSEFNYVSEPRLNMRPITENNLPPYLPPSPDKAAFELPNTDNIASRFTPSGHPEYDNIIDKKFNLLTAPSPGNTNFNPLTLSQPTIDQSQLLNLQQIPGQQKISSLQEIQPNKYPEISLTFVHPTTDDLYTPMANNVPYRISTSEQPSYYAMIPQTYTLSDFSIKPVPENKGISPHIIQPNRDQPIKILPDQYYQQIPNQIKMIPLPKRRPTINSYVIEKPQSLITDPNVPYYLQPKIGKPVYDMPLTKNIFESKVPNQPLFNTMSARPYQVWNNLSNNIPEKTGSIVKTISQPFIDPIMYGQPTVKELPKQYRQSQDIPRQFNTKSIPVIPQINPAINIFHKSVISDIQPDLDGSVSYTPISNIRKSKPLIIPVFYDTKNKPEYLYSSTLKWPSYIPAEQFIGKQDPKKYGIDYTPEPNEIRHYYQVPNKFRLNFPFSMQPDINLGNVYERPTTNNIQNPYVQSITYDAVSQMPIQIIDLSKPMNDIMKISPDSIILPQNLNSPLAADKSPEKPMLNLNNVYQISPENYQPNLSVGQPTKMSPDLSNYNQMQPMKFLTIPKEVGFSPILPLLQTPDPISNKLNSMEPPLYDLYKPQTFDAQMLKEPVVYTNLLQKQQTLSSTGTPSTIEKPIDTVNPQMYFETPQFITMPLNNDNKQDITTLFYDPIKADEALQNKSPTSPAYRPIINAGFEAPDLLPLIDTKINIPHKIFGSISAPINHVPDTSTTHAYQVPIPNEFNIDRQPVIKAYEPLKSQSIPESEYGSRAKWPKTILNQPMNLNKNKISVVPSTTTYEPYGISDLFPSVDNPITKGDLVSLYPTQPEYNSINLDNKPTDSLQNIYAHPILDDQIKNKNSRIASQYSDTVNLPNTLQFMPIGAQKDLKYYNVPEIQPAVSPTVDVTAKPFIPMLPNYQPEYTDLNPISKMPENKPEMSIPLEFIGTESYIKPSNIPTSHQLKLPNEFEILPQKPHIPLKEREYSPIYIDQSIAGQELDLTLTPEDVLSNLQYGDFIKPKVVPLSPPTIEIPLKSDILPHSYPKFVPKKNYSDLESISPLTFDPNIIATTQTKKSPDYQSEPFKFKKLASEYDEIPILQSSIIPKMDITGKPTYKPTTENLELEGLNQQFSQKTNNQPTIGTQTFKQFIPTELNINVIPPPTTNNQIITKEVLTPEYPSYVSKLSTHIPASRPSYPPIKKIDFKPLEIDQMLNHPVYSQPTATQHPVIADDMTKIPVESYSSINYYQPLHTDAVHTKPKTFGLQPNNELKMHMPKEPIGIPIFEDYAKIPYQGFKNLKPSIGPKSPPQLLYTDPKHLTQKYLNYVQPTTKNQIFEEPSLEELGPVYSIYKTKNVLQPEPNFYKDLREFKQVPNEFEFSPFVASDPVFIQKIGEKPQYDFRPQLFINLKNDRLSAPLNNYRLNNNLKQNSDPFVSLNIDKLYEPQIKLLEPSNYYQVDLLNPLQNTNKLEFVPIPASKPTDFRLKAVSPNPQLNQDFENIVPNIDSKLIGISPVPIHNQGNLGNPNTLFDKPQSQKKSNKPNIDPLLYGPYVKPNNYDNPSFEQPISELSRKLMPIMEKPMAQLSQLMDTSIPLDNIKEKSSKLQNMKPVVNVCPLHSTKVCPLLDAVKAKELTYSPIKSSLESIHNERSEELPDKLHEKLGDEAPMLTRQISPAIYTLKNMINEPNYLVLNVPTQNQIQGPGSTVSIIDEINIRPIIEFGEYKPKELKQIYNKIPGQSETLPSVVQQISPIPEKIIKTNQPTTYTYSDKPLIKNTTKLKPYPSQVLKQWPHDILSATYTPNQPKLIYPPDISTTSYKTKFTHSPSLTTPLYKVLTDEQLEFSTQNNNFTQISPTFYKLPIDVLHQKPHISPQILATGLTDTPYEVLRLEQFIKPKLEFTPNLNINQQSTYRIPANLHEKSTPILPILPENDMTEKLTYPYRKDKYKEIPDKIPMFETNYHLNTLNISSQEYTPISIDKQLYKPTEMQPKYESSSIGKIPEIRKSLYDSQPLMEYSKTKQMRIPQNIIAEHLPKIIPNIPPYKPIDKHYYTPLLKQTYDPKTVSLPNLNINNLKSITCIPILPQKSKQILLDYEHTNDNKPEDIYSIQPHDPMQFKTEYLDSSHIKPCLPHRSSKLTRIPCQSTPLNLVQPQKIIGSITQLPSGQSILSPIVTEESPVSTVKIMPSSSPKSELLRKTYPTGSFYKPMPKLTSYLNNPLPPLSPFSKPVLEQPNIKYFSSFTPDVFPTKQENLPLKLRQLYSLDKPVYDNEILNYDYEIRPVNKSPKYSIYTQNLIPPISSAEFTKDNSKSNFLPPFYKLLTKTKSIRYIDSKYTPSMKYRQNYLPISSLTSTPKLEYNSPIADFSSKLFSKVRPTTNIFSTPILNQLPVKSPCFVCPPKISKVSDRTDIMTKGIPCKPSLPNTNLLQTEEYISKPCKLISNTLEIPTESTMYNPIIKRPCFVYAPKLGKFFNKLFGILPCKPVTLETTKLDRQTPTEFLKQYDNAKISNVKFLSNPNQICLSCYYPTSFDNPCTTYDCQFNRLEQKNIDQTKQLYTIPTQVCRPPLAKTYYNKQPLFEYLKSETLSTFPYVYNNQIQIEPCKPKENYYEVLTPSPRNSIIKPPCLVCPSELSEPVDEISQKIPTQFTYNLPCHILPCNSQQTQKILQKPCDNVELNNNHLSKTCRPVCPPCYYPSPQPETSTFNYQSPNTDSSVIYRKIFSHILKMAPYIAKKISSLPSSQINNIKEVTIPLDEIESVEFTDEPEDKSKLFFIRTEHPNIKIKSWISESNIKKLKLKLVYKDEGCSNIKVYNFMPVFNGSDINYEEVQEIAKKLIEKYYGTPIIMKEFPKSKPFIVIDDIDKKHIKNGRCYILWPCVCNNTQTRC